MKRIILAAVAGLGMVFSAGADSPKEKGFQFNQKQQKNRYYKVFKKWETRDAKVVDDADAVLFIGSSSMRMWRNIKKDLAPLKVIHCGFGGSTMGQVLVFEDFFLRYKAGRIVIYEGDNDMMGRLTPEKFVKQCKKYCDDVFKLRPKTKIWFIGPKPSISRWRKQAKYSEANKQLKAYCDSDPRLNFIDVVTPMLGKDGTPLKDIFLKDKLHMNLKGYAIWTKAVRDAFGLGPVPAPTGSVKNGIFIKFGNETSLKDWNSVTAGVRNITGLVDAKGEMTGVSLKLADRFAGVNNSGTSKPAKELQVPAKLSTNSLFGQDKNNKAVIEISGLNKDKKYNLTFYASRMGVKDNRETVYNVVGASTAKAVLNVANNTDKAAKVEAIQPTKNGKIVITINKGKNNTNNKGYYYLGTMKLVEVK